VLLVLDSVIFSVADIRPLFPLASLPSAARKVRQKDFKELRKQST